MSTLNLSPKNPLVMGALAIGAVWLLSRRAATAGTTARPAPVGASTVNGTVAPALEALGSVLRAAGSLFGTTASGSAYGVPDEAARAAVRVGDPYYGGSAAVTGNDPSWMLQAELDAAAWRAMNYDTGSTGDPYNPDGGYWLN